jgi:tRNA A-37 threonylcarbamoyl transferase component Bud32
MNGNDQSGSNRCSVCGARHASNGCPASDGARVGAVLEGKYELVRLIGQGGMGEVYEGRHRVIGRRVAVKFLHGQHLQNPDTALRFESEARVAGGSEHENIASVYDVGTLPDGTRYLVMEFLDGEDVDKLVRREAPLPISQSAFIVIQACRGLDAVHKRGIIHRDLKPANLFLAKRAEQADLVKVLDFGIAKLRTGDDRGGTKTGTAIGTAHYMSPEQARGERTVDARSDVYSLGVVLYELLSGKKPHDGDSLLQILHKVMTEPPVPLEGVRAGLPDALHTVVRRAMAPDVAERYATVAELGKALLPFAGWPLPPLRSQPAAFAGPASDAGETRAYAASALDLRLPPAGASVIGVVRSEPNALKTTLRERTPRSRNSRRLAAGGILGTTAVLAIVALSFLRTRPRPVRPTVEQSSALTTMAPAARWAHEFPSPATSVTPLAAASPAVPDAPAPAVSVAAGTTSTSVRPSGHRTPPSGHPAGTTPVATTQAAVPTLHTVVSAAAVAATPTVPPSRPTATDRGDNPF